MQLRRSLIATGAVAVLAVSGVTAAVANDPPPRIAFLANGIVPADALAAGPIAGQLGAPIYTTAPGSLIESTGMALDAYDPDLVIVMGGPAAISDGVLAQVADVTGLSVEEASPPPTSGIVRAAGADRFETAAAAAALLGSYDPAFLPTDMQAADSDKLDGKDSSAFQPAGDYLGTTEKAADSDKLDGKASSAFVQDEDIAIVAVDTAVNTSTAVNPDVFDISTPAGTLMIDFDISCTSFNGTTDTRWDLDLELDGTTVGRGIVLFFPHEMNTSVGASASMSVAVDVSAATHTVGYSAGRPSGDGSLDCNIHARGNAVAVTGQDVPSAATSAASSAPRSPQGADLR